MGEENNGYENWYENSENEVHGRWGGNKHLTRVAEYRWDRATVPPFKRWENDEELKFLVSDPRQWDEGVYPIIPPDSYKDLREFKDLYWIKEQVDPCPGRACATSGFFDF
jgi:hypothetical protein